MATARQRVTDFMAQTDGPMFVPDIQRATGVKTGRVYVVLAELERRGAVVSGWADPVLGSRWRRRWYTRGPMV